MLPEPCATVHDGGDAAAIKTNNKTVVVQVTNNVTEVYVYDEHGDLVEGTSYP